MAMDPKEQAADKSRAAWHQGQKLRKHLVKLLEKSKENSRSGLDTVHLETIDQFLEQFRLACVATIFLDFEYAVSEQTEDILWGLHVSINAEYRRLMHALRTEKRVVEQRKVEAKYGHFLRIAQKFYKGYIQRLSARYEIKELKRVAKNIQAEDMPAQDVIVPKGDLGHKILVSCYQTLIHLGDLSRYRVQAKQKKSYDTAQAFYSVAHDLIPESGYAYHQMGIVNQDEGNHLDVLYHFYRAWAVKDPHPRAQQNLEAKFKSIKGQHASPRGKTPASAHDALIVWFVKLHALFYKGEPVSTQYNELEREVIHRLGPAIKDTNFSLAILKMALVNMSACHIASSKNASGANETAKSSFFQYTLHFNARFILKVCEVIQNAFEAMLAIPADDPNSVKQAGEHQATIMAVLPVLRVYGMWIAAHIPELFRSPLAPHNVLPPLLRNLAKVLTFFCREVDANTQDLDTCPYLLQEDIEIRGLLPLDVNRVPLGCLSYYKRQGVIKPHLESANERLDQVKESRCRLFDILRCGYILAKEVDVPLAHPYINGSLVFIYEADAQDAEPPAKPVISPTTETEAGVATSAQSVLPMNGANGQVEGQPTTPSFRQNAQKQQTSLEDQQMEQMDKTVADMLSPFMDSPGTKAEPQEEPTYGMHAASANDVAQQLLNLFQPSKDGPTPYYQSISPGTYHSSPWGQYISGGSSGAQGNSGLGHLSGSIRAPSALSLSSPRSEGANGHARQGLQQQYAGANTASAVSPSYASSAHMYGAPGRPAASVGSRGIAGAPSSYDWSRSPLQAAQHYVPPEQATSTYPLSSGYSAFTNASSVYQGTPVCGNVYGENYLPVPETSTQFGASPNASHVFGEQNGASFGAAKSPSRQSVAQTSASTYDSRIFEAAMQGQK